MPAPIVTPSQADTVLEVNRANAIKQAIGKVKAKKTLTKPEIELLQSIAFSPDSALGVNAHLTEAKTVVELAGALGVSRRSISNWRKLEGAPEAASNGTHDVLAWRQFMKEKGLNSYTTEDEENLKVRKLLAEVNEREFRLSIRKGEYIRRDLVRETWLSRCGRVVNLMRSKLEKEMPPLLVGKDAPSIQEALSLAIDEILSSLHDGKDESLTP